MQFALVHLGTSESELITMKIVVHKQDQEFTIQRI